MPKRLSANSTNCSTMRTLELTPAIKRAYKKFVKNNPRLLSKIDEALKHMEKDPFSPFLETHKLGGKFKGILACSCGYDCRILFTIERHNQTVNEIIVLHGIGTHDSVY